jgi:hypothetical protein
MYEWSTPIKKNLNTYQEYVFCFTRFEILNGFQDAVSKKIFLRSENSDTLFSILEPKYCVNLYIYLAIVFSTQSQRFM